jgi:DNA polymerase I
LSCHLALGWQLPASVLDLCIEFKNLTNGLEMPGGKSLLDALVYFGLDSMDAVEKDKMRQLAMQGGPYTAQEVIALLDYCESDVVALRKLITAMLPKLDVRRAVLRGRYMNAVARMEFAGVPIDAELLRILRENWELLQEQMIARVDASYGVFESRTFKTQQFESYLAVNGIDWPRLATGRLALDDDTFRQMARMFPVLEPLRQLRTTLSQMRLNELAVGSDGRNRCNLWAFGAKTARNQPSNTRFIFGPAAWMRGLIQPQPGYGLAYIDWSQQEFGIAAALSRDPAMLEAYSSGDPYLKFAIQAAAAPVYATKATHPAEREQFKQCTLAVQYGMGEESLAERIGQPVTQAKELLRLHHMMYPEYWRWQGSIMDHTKLRRELPTVFGWTLHLGPAVKARTVANYPMQANGSELLRLACCLITEAGITVCAPVHDAILIEAPADQLSTVVEKAQSLMASASDIVLGGVGSARKPS